MKVRRVEVFRFDGRYTMDSEDVVRFAAVVRTATACRRRIEIEAIQGGHFIGVFVIAPAPAAILKVAAEKQVA